MSIRSEALGRHLFVDLYECDERRLNDLEFIKKIMTEAAKVSRATIVDRSFHRFKPHGVSGVVVIAESHISIHTWPEFRCALVDILTCGKDMKPEKAVELLKGRLCAKSISIDEKARMVLPVSVRGLTG